MDLEALKQTLASLDINPDEIEDKRYATAFRILFAIIEKQNEENKTLKVENQKLRDENNLLKGEQTNEILEKTGNRIQARTKSRSIKLKPAKLIGLFYLKMLFLKVIVTQRLE